MRKFDLQACMNGSGFQLLKGGTLVISAFTAGATYSYAAPTGGVVTSGAANITQNGSVTTVDQSTQKAAINWRGFSIGAGETVNFNQPNANSLTLNRVVGNEKSIIDGALNATGQVWILNSNGVLFNANAKVNASGLLATTKALSDEAFQAGQYSFEGDSTASVINLGEITINNGGYASLLANSVQNAGSIKAVHGTVTLTGASEATINLNGNSLVSLIVDKGVLDALVENRGVIMADGGDIYLTSNAADELLRGVVNNSGHLQANTLDDVTGNVVVFAHGGTANISGSITATGGFVETSGDSLNVRPDAVIQARNWLLDPTDITITDASAYNTALNNGTSVTIETTSGAGSGDITISASIAKTTGGDATLTLKAARNITIDSGISITSVSNSLDTVLWANSAGTGGGIVLNAGSSIHTNGGDLWMGGGSGTTTWNGLAVGNGAAKGVGTAISGINLSGASGDIVDISTDGGSIKMSGAGSDAGGHGVYMQYAQVATGTSGAIDIRGDGYSAVSGVGSGHGLNVLESSIVAGSGGLSLTGNANLNHLSSGHAGLNMSNAALYAKGGGSVGLNVSSTNDYIQLQSFGSDGSTIGDATNQTGNITITASGTSAGKVTLPNIETSGGLTVDVAGSSAGTVSQHYTDFFGSDYSSKIVVGGASTFVGNSAAAYYLNGAENDFSGAVSVHGGATLALYDSNSLHLSVIDGLSGTQDITAADGIALSYTLDSQTGFTYNGNAVVLSDLWGVGSIFGVSFASSWVYGTDYVFKDSAGNAVASYTNAGNYSGLTVDILKSGYSTAGDGNVAGSLTIDRKSVGVTVSKIYDGTASFSSGFLLNSADIVNGDTVSVASGAAQVASANAGSYDGFVGNTIVLTNSNYSVNDGVSATIEKKPIGINVSKTYDGSAVFAEGFTPQSSDVVAGDTVTVSGVASVSGANAGTYNAFETDSLVVSNSNYTLVGGGVSAIIEKANATVTAKSDSKTYNGQAQSVSGFTATGLVNGETVAVLTDVVTTGGVGTSVGEYMHTASGSALNYNLSFVSGKLTITASPVLSYTLSSIVSGYTYTGNAISLDALWAPGSIFGDSYASWQVGVDYVFKSGGAVVSSYTDAGTYSGITVDILNSAYSVAATGNTTGSLVIGKADATVTANSGSKVYNGQTQSISGFSVSGLVNGETAAVLEGVTTSGGSGQSVGEYVHTVSGVDNNYNLTFVNGKLTILPNQTVDDSKTVVASVESTVQAQQSQNIEDSSSSMQEKGAVVDGLIGEMTAAQKIADLRDSGYSVRDLKQAGYSADDLKGAGYSAVELNDSGYSLQDLKGAGFSARDVAQAINYSINKNAFTEDGTLRYDPSKVSRQTSKLLALGYSAAEILDAGYTVATLRADGNSAASLKKVGFSIDDLKGAGYSAGEMKAAGYSASDLKAAGYSVSQIMAAGYSAGEVQGNGYSLAEMKKNGYSAADLKRSGYSAGDMKAAGYTAADLKKAGYAVAELKAAGYSAADLKEAGYSATELNQAGFSIGDLKVAGFGVADLKQAGYKPDSLKSAGFSAGEMKEGGYGTTALKQLGYSAAEQRAAGVSLAELKSLGYGVAQLKDAANSPRELTEMGYSVASLKQAGYATAELLGSGYSAKELKSAGYSAAELKTGGADVLGLGFSASALKAAGCSVAELKKSKYSIAEMKSAGYAISELRAGGYSAAELMKAGVALADLKSGGYSAAELQGAGVSSAQLRGAGFAVADVVGLYSAADLKKEGFSAAELKSKHSEVELKNAGYSASDMRGAGYKASDLRAAGYSIKDLKAAGYSNAEMQASGFSASELKAAGF